MTITLARLLRHQEALERPFASSAADVAAPDRINRQPALPLSYTRSALTQKLRPSSTRASAMGSHWRASAPRMSLDGGEQSIIPFSRLTIHV